MLHFPPLFFIFPFLIVVRPLNVLAVSTQTLLVLSNPTALRKIVAVLQSFVFCLSVFVPSKTENDKDKQKSGGRRGPSLPLWPMPGKDYTWWSECSSRIVSCRDSLFQSAPSEHITFYCCLLAGNSFLARTLLWVWFVFFPPFMAFDWRLKECIHLRHKQLETHTDAHTHAHKLIFIGGKWLFLLPFPEMSSLLSVEGCCECLRLFYSLLWPWPEAPKSLN